LNTIIAINFFLLNYQKAEKNPIQVEIYKDFYRLPKNKKINLDAYSNSQAKNIITEAWSVAKQYQDAKVSAIHVLIATLSSDQTRIIMSRLGIDPQALRLRIGSVLSRQVNGSKSVAEEEVVWLLSWAYMNAQASHRKMIEPMDILLACVFLDQDIAEMFYDLNITPNKIENVVSWLDVRQKIRQNWQRMKSKAIFRPKSSMDRAMTALETRMLDAYGLDLTRMVQYGYTMPCIGRDDEIENIFQIMSGGVRRSVLLVGQSGVGKNSIIEGIAQRMVAEDVPRFLQDKRLVTLNIASLTSGSSNNIVQQRLVRILYEIKRAGNVILHIDNIDSLIGISSNNESAFDLAAVIAQAVSENVILCIATCNKNAYDKSIQGKHSIDSVFEMVSIAEPEKDSAIQIVQSKVGQVEYQYKVFFSYDAIEKLVELSSRYMTDRQLPEKAIELLQEVSAFTSANKKENSIVTANDVAQIISKKTSIPLTNITNDESEKLLNLESIIHQRVVGQHEAVKMVSASLRRARAEMRDNLRPIANLLFLGPTGVGKTELAKAVAEAYFGDEKKMIRLDMSEYQDALSIHRLIGSPTNRSETGFFTKAVKENPFSLVLLDELEKAHSDIINIFLQIMDDGRLTDSEGRLIDFTNTIIIATSNAGTELIQQRINEGIEVNAISQELVDNELGKYFRPELLNRFDGIIVFKPLTMTDVREIASLMLNKVAEVLERKGVLLQSTPAGIDFLANLGFDPKFGARPLRRVIQEQIQDKIAELVLRNELNRRDTVLIGDQAELSIIKAKEF